MINKLLWQALSNSKQPARPEFYVVIPLRPLSNIMVIKIIGDYCKNLHEGMPDGLSLILNKQQHFSFF